MRLSSLSLGITRPSGRAGGGDAIPLVARYEPRLQGIADGDPIPALVDQAHTNDIPQETTTMRATYDATAEAAYFDGVDDYYLAAGTMPDYREWYGVIEVVAKYGTNGYWGEIGNTPSTGRVIFRNANDDLNLRTFTPEDVRTSFVDAIPGALEVTGNKVLIHVRTDGNFVRCSLNGGTEAVLDAGGDMSLPLRWLTVGAGDGNVTIAHYLHELAIADTLTTAQRTSLISSLMTKWGISA